MEPIEEKLKHAMRQVDPPAGFAARVMARVEARPTAARVALKKPRFAWWEWLRHWTTPPVSVGAAAILVLVTLLAGLGHWGRPTPPAISDQGQIAGEKATAQLMLALHITGTRLSRMHALLAQPPGDPTAGGQPVQPDIRN